MNLSPPRGERRLRSATVNRTSCTSVKACPDQGVRIRLKGALDRAMVLLEDVVRCRRLCTFMEKRNGNH
jgi:hypothetical protein